MKLRIAIAVLLALIFSLITIPTFFIRSVVKTYLNPAFYEGEVIEESHEYLIEFLNDQIADDENISSYLNEEDINKLTTDYVTSESLRTVVQDFIAQLNNISDGRNSNRIAVSLMPLKEKIPNMATDIAVYILDHTPDCEYEIEDIDVFLNDPLPNCIPTEIERSVIENPLSLEIEKNLYDIIPGEFSLDLNSSGNSENTSFTQLLFIFKYAQMILPLFMLILLLLIALIIYKPYTRIMKFIGGSFIFGGVFSLIAGQLLAQVPSLYREYINGLSEFYSFIVNFIVERINIYSVYFIGIGGLVVLIAFYLSHYYEKHPHINDSQ